MCVAQGSDTFKNSHFWPFPLNKQEPQNLLNNWNKVKNIVLLLGFSERQAVTSHPHWSQNNSEQNTVCCKTISGLTLNMIVIFKIKYTQYFFTQPFHLSACFYEHGGNFKFSLWQTKYILDQFSVQMTLTNIVGFLPVLLSRNFGEHFAAKFSGTLENHKVNPTLDSLTS